MPTPRWLAPLFRRPTRPIVTRATARLRAEELEPREVPALAVAGAAPGELPLVRVFDSGTLQTVGLFPAFGLGYRDGVNAALGDVNGDGTQEVIVATAGGDGPAFVRVLDLSGNEVRTLPPIAVVGGLNVASGDLNGDGSDDIVVSTVRGGLVGAFSGATGELMGVIAPYSANFVGGVQVAVADMDGDGDDDIVTAPRAGGALVKAFQGTTLTEMRTYDAAAGYTGPVNLAAGDVNGDGEADILLGTGAGMLPAAALLDGATGRLDSLFVLPVNTTGGMTVGIGPDADGDGHADLLLGPGGTPAVVSVSSMTNAINGVGLLPGGRVGGGLSSAPRSAPAPVPAPAPAPNAPPAVTLPAAFSGDENSPLALGGVRVADPDAGTAAVRVSLGVTRGTLTLGTAAGTGDTAVTLTGTLDAVNTALAGLTYRPTPGYVGGDQLTVTVDDLGNTGAGGPKTATATAAITVNNVNDAPVVTGGTTAAVSVPENTTAVTTVTATDPDVGTTLTYSIAGGADAARFAINPATGVLTFLTAPDFETPADVGGDNVYDVVVRASDGELSAEQAIAVTVTGVNDNAPVITSNGGGATAATSVTEGTTGVTTVTATDADAGTTLTYSIAGGADAARFAIDPATGVLAFSGAPVFATPADVGGDNVYDVVVRVYDGTNTATQAIAVRVAAPNANAPVIVSDGGGATAAVSVAAGQTAVTTVMATDADAGTTLTYSIVGGADMAQFTIDPATGMLSFMVTPNPLVPADVGGDNVYDVIVQVYDGLHTATQAIAVTVGSPNQAPVLTVSSSTLLVLPGLIYLVDASVSDPDVGTGDLAVTVSVTGPGTPLLQLLSIGGLTFTGGTNPIGQTISFTGDQTSVNGALSALYLISSPSLGTGTITYTVSDLGNTGTGGPLSDTETRNYETVI
jgi:serralysin